MERERLECVRLYKEIRVILLVVWFLSLALGLASFCYGKGS